MMTTMTYPNTLRLTFAGLTWAEPPRGRHLRVWNFFRTEIPALDGARIHTDIGRMLQIEIERTMGNPEQRRALVAEVARRFNVEVQSMADNGTPRSVTHWVVDKVDGIQVIVSTKICECHDGLEHTLGVFPDKDDVIDAQVGRALRMMAPPEQHALIGQAEALRDAARAVETS